MKLLLLAVLTFNIAYADENCEQHSHPELSDLLDVAKELNWEAVSDSNVKNAFCTRKTPFTEDEMNRWMSANESSHRASEKINGIQFTDESPENLETFKYLTTTMDYADRAVPDKTRTFTSQCTKVNCALKEIFGETGTQLQFMQRRFGFNGSHLVKDNTSSWKKKELDTILMSLTDYPAGILPVKKSRPLIHATRGGGNGRTIANAVVTIYDLWNEITPEQQRATITHELGHVLAGMTKVDDAPTWTSKSQWQQVTKIVDGKEETEMVPNRPETIVSEYGMTNSWEDLAESAVAYRYNPNTLKAASPEKYALIKELIFDNVEFTSQEACENPTRLSQTYANKVETFFETWTPTTDELNVMTQHCGPLALEKVYKEGSVTLDSPALLHCYENAVQAEANRRISEEIKSLPNAQYLAPMIRNAKINILPSRLQSLANDTRMAHGHLLKADFTKAFSDKYACDSKLKIYANQKFNHAALGIKNYEYRDELIGINQKFCDSKQSPASYAATLVK